MKIITIGRRCTSDAILGKFKKRFFSGPFSNLLVDFETALVNINNKFEFYFNNIVKYNNSDFRIKYLPHYRMTKLFYINKLYTEEILNKNIYDLKRLLIWNHYNMFDKEIIKTFKRRINRINTYLKNEKCCLF